MHRLVPHWDPRVRGPLASFAALALAVSACGGSGAVTPTTGSTATTAPVASRAAASSAPATATAVTPTQTVAPSASAIAELPLLWQGGGPITARTTTQSIAVHPGTGQIWVSVPFENQYWILSPVGKYLESWGTAGTGPGQFDLNDHLQNPDGFGAIAFAPDGSFYVGDVGNHRVQKFDAKRKFVKTWGTFGSGDGEFAAITAVATNGKTVYVGDGGRGDIQAFDSNGTYLRTFGTDGGFSAFIALDQGGNVYATNPETGVSAVAKFDPSGKEISRFDRSSIGDAVGLAVDPQGNIFVGAVNTTPPYGSLGTYKLDPDGRVLRGWSIGGGEGLALSTNGDVLYVSRGIGLRTGDASWQYIRAYAIPKD